MTAQDHNKTIGIIYSFLGGAVAVVLCIFIVKAVKVSLSISVEHKDSFPFWEITSALFGASLFMSIAYGLFKRRRWARISTLVLTGLFIWLFPLGTAFAIYTWWFMHSEGGRQLYSRSST
jgi:ABC-type Fe3+-siderophore transport system permease subunit